MEEPALERCEHEWVEIDREKRVTMYIQPKIFTDGAKISVWRILQQCKKCNKLNTVDF